MTLTTIQWISLAIFISGIILFLYFVFRKHDFRKKVIEEVEEYKETVKELVPELKSSKRKKTEEDEEDEEHSGSLISNLLPVGVTLVVVAVVLSFGLQILNDVKSSLSVNSASYNSSSASLESLSTVSSQLPMIGVVLAAAIVISILVKAFNNY